MAQGRNSIFGANTEYMPQKKRKGPGAFRDAILAKFPGLAQKIPKWKATTRISARNNSQPYVSQADIYEPTWTPPAPPQTIGLSVFNQSTLGGSPPNFVYSNKRKKLGNA